MFTSSKKQARELAEGDEILMEYNEEVEKAGSNVEIITAYDRREAARFEGHEEGFDEGYEEGREEGYEEGREEGRKKGRAEGRKEGREEGRKEGLKQGTEQRSIEIAKEMLKENYSLDQIHQITKLPIDKIKELTK